MKLIQIYLTLNLLGTNFLAFVLLLFFNVSLLDPDPHIEFGSGSKRRNQKWVRIRINFEANPRLLGGRQKNRSQLSGRQFCRQNVQENIQVSGFGMTCTQCCEAVPFRPGSGSS